MVSFFGTKSNHLYVSLLEKPNESTIKTITSLPTFEHLVEAEKFVIDNAWKRYNECNFTKKFNEIMKNAKDYAYYLEITKGKQTDDNVKFIKKINKKIKLSTILIHRLNKINKEKDKAFTIFTKDRNIYQQIIENNKKYYLETKNKKEKDKSISIIWETLQILEQENATFLNTLYSLLDRLEEIRKKQLTIHIFFVKYGIMYTVSNPIIFPKKVN